MNEKDFKFIQCENMIQINGFTAKKCENPAIIYDWANDRKVCDLCKPEHEYIECDNCGTNGEFADREFYWCKSYGQVYCAKCKELEVN